MVWRRSNGESCGCSVPLLARHFLYFAHRSCPLEVIYGVQNTDLLVFLTSKDIVNLSFEFYQHLVNSVEVFQLIITNCQEFPSYSNAISGEV